MKEIIFKSNFKFHSPKHGGQKTTFRKEEKQLTSIQLQTIQNVAEGKTKFSNPNTPKQDKIKRRVQNFKKIGKIVASATRPFLSSL